MTSQADPISLPKVPASNRNLALAAALLVAVIAAVHFQQYVDFINQVPTIGVLFLLNAGGGAGLAAALAGTTPRLRQLAALGGIGLAGGSLISIGLALSGGIFGYQEPTLRAPIVLAIVTEVLAIPVLALLAHRDAHTRREPN